MVKVQESSHHEIQEARIAFLSTSLPKLGVKICEVYSSEVGTKHPEIGAVLVHPNCDHKSTRM